MHNKHKSTGRDVVGAVLDSGARHLSLRGEEGCAVCVMRGHHTHFSCEFRALMTESSVSMT